MENVPFTHSCHGSHFWSRQVSAIHEVKEQEQKCGRLSLADDPLIGLNFSRLCQVTPNSVATPGPPTLCKNIFIIECETCLPTH